MIGHRLVGARRLAIAVASLVAVVPLLGLSPAPVHAETFPITGAVVWKVDDKAKTVTVTVKLAFYNRSCPAFSSCPPPSAADISRIKSAIEKYWNTGLKVKCYTFHVEVDARAVGSQSEAGRSEVDVGLDYSAVAIRAFVAATVANADANGKTNPLGNDPGDRLEVGHSDDSPTRWPAQTYEQTYAHEFGHILGLDDNYVEGTKLPYPGASDDLMFRKQGDVTPEMVKRAVERSGQVKLKDLKCGWTFNGDTPIGQHRGLKCDGLGGDWTIRGHDVLPGGGDVTSLWNVTINEATLAGTYRQEKIQTLTGSVTTLNAAGKARIVVQPDDSVLMTLDAATTTLKTVTIVGSKSVTIPGQTLTFPWETDEGGACP